MRVDVPDEFIFVMLGTPRLAEGPAFFTVQPKKRYTETKMTTQSDFDPRMRNPGFLAKKLVLLFYVSAMKSLSLNKNSRRILRPA